MQTWINQRPLDEKLCLRWRPMSIVDRCYKDHMQAYIAYISKSISLRSYPTFSSSSLWVVKLQNGRKRSTWESSRENSLIASERRERQPLEERRQSVSRRASNRSCQPRFSPRSAGSLTRLQIFRANFGLAGASLDWAKHWDICREALEVQEKAKDTGTFLMIGFCMCLLKHNPFFC